MKSIAFPSALLFAAVPMPLDLENSLEALSQVGSTFVATALFGISGTAVFQQGNVLRLPGIVLEVARECSGIHSSWVLFITSLIAGYMFLRTPWRRFLLASCVIPLAILRNGFRVFVIGMLCVYIDPGMIDSWVHRKGGPLFFLLSLVPFFALLLLLRRGERARKPDNSVFTQTGQR
jgi:exosortase